MYIYLNVKKTREQKNLSASVINNSSHLISNCTVTILCYCFVVHSKDNNNNSNKNDYYYYIKKNNNNNKKELNIQS